MSNVIGFSTLQEEVIGAGLCVGCGTCVGICPENAIEISRDGEIALVRPCAQCGTCVRCCPGANIDVPGLTRQLFHENSNGQLGHIERAYLACSGNEHIRLSGSSGGVITSLLTSMIDTGVITGAIIADFNEAQPVFPESKIARSAQEILRAAGSKYMLFPHNTVLRRIRETNDESLAFVGLPCHVHAMRKVERVVPDAVRSIKYYIGLYCGLNLTRDVTQGISERFRIKNVNAIRSVRYRDGKWPGDFSLTLKNGANCRMTKMCFNYLNFLYTPKRCLMCIDLANEFSDISVGDGWLKETNGRTPGWSVVLVRTHRGKEIVQAAAATGKLTLEEIAVREAEQMHAHGIENKKRGSFARMQMARKAGRAVPDYHVRFPAITRKRFLLEELNCAVLALGQKNVIRRVINRIPLSAMERVMTVLRKRLVKGVRDHRDYRRHLQASGT